MRTRLSSLAALLGLALVPALGCPKPPPAAGPEPASPSSAPSAPAEPASVGPAAEPEQVAAELAAAWCESGGEAFRGPVARPDDDYPRALESCDEIEAAVIASDARDGTRVSVIRLEAGGLEVREAIVYQRGDETHVGWLFQMEEDQSGEAGSYDRDYRDIELRDVGGGRELEWVAVVVEEEGDSFEADRCYAHTSATSSLLICGPRPDRFACALAQFSTLGESRPRAEEDLYDCDDDPDNLEPARTTGFANRYAFEGGGVVFTPDPDAAIDAAEDPPYTGAVTLETLFDESALDVD